MGVAVYYVLTSVTCFVIFVNCGVLEKQVIKYEGETLELACFPDQNEKVEWGIRSIFQGHQLQTLVNHDPYRRIYTNFGFQRGFNFTGRYSISIGNGYYNLTIKNLNISETGEYVCWENGGQGRTSSTRVSVYVNISLLQADRSSVIVAETVTLRCPRQFGGPVRWLYVKSENSSQEVISKDKLIQSKYTGVATVVYTAKDYNLSLHNVQFNQSGYYICIEDGLLFYKTPVLLTVLVNLSTFKSPEKITVFSGDRDVTLPCRPGFAGTVRWFYARSRDAQQIFVFDRNIVESKFMNKVTVNNDHLSRDYNVNLHVVQLNEHGWYICYIDYDDDSLFIHPVLLIVKVDVSRYREVQRLSCFIGRSVILPCRTNFSDFRDLQRWLYISPHNTSQADITIGGDVSPKFNSHVQLNISQTSREYNLTLLDVQLNETGWYICVGVSDNDHATEHPFFLTVDVPTPPKIMVQPQAVVAFKSGESVTLKCQAVGSSELVYSWKLDGEALTVDPERGVKILSEGTLELMKPEEGKYQCFVSNEFGTAASDKSSVKLGFPPSITVHPATEVVSKAGDPVTLKCQAVGSGELKYSWELDGEALTVDPERGVEILSEGTLELMKPEEGKYQCYVSNEFGTAASDKSSVKLGLPPIITVYPAMKVAFKAGDPVTLKCQAVGSGELKYSWELDGEALTVDPERGVKILSEGTLELVKPEEGKYQCFVSNIFGTAASVVSSVKLETDVSQAIILTGVSVAVGVIVIVIVAIVCCMKRRGVPPPVTQCLLTPDESSGSGQGQHPKHATAQVTTDNSAGTVHPGISTTSQGERSRQLTSKPVADKSSGAVVQRVPTSQVQQTTAKRIAVSHVISSSSVAGVAIYSDKLFVLRERSRGRIEQFDVKTFQQEESIKVNGLSDDSYGYYKSMTSCDINSCLYINDEYKVFRVNPSTKDVFSWPVDGDPCGLSVNETRNVLVTCYWDDTIKEYSTDGSFVRSIKLQVDHVKNPLHCIQLTDSRYVVCHGYPVPGVYGVSEIDKHGTLIATYRNSETTELEMYWPRCVILFNDSLLVADMFNDRILLLNTSLRDARPLSLPVDSQLSRPRCMYLEQSRGRLFVGEESGRVLVIDNIDLK